MGRRVRSILLLPVVLAAAACGRQAEPSPHGRAEIEQAVDQAQALAEQSADNASSGAEASSRNRSH
ncbi:hypothetical protein E2493_01475 [Sphingomonas parva]|uniref:Secreted protein n=1 Tax=Sphingomonas parva TaxID=2555898 RepID=A0A4Y8ZV94_9SPHN|nr:hypothetical protein [Sphingomonas parva]TFI59948.1 hypothetical protein E2493_01475 [Sphingomonas parva]